MIKLSYLSPPCGGLFIFKDGSLALDLIFKDKKFWPLFWTQFLGALNDNFFKNALVILVTYKAVTLAGMKPELLVPLAGGIFIFPFFIFSATAGQIADKFEKSLVIRATKISELVVMIIASVGFYLDNYELLFFVLFLMGGQSAFFGPLKYGVIPSLVPPEKLVLGTAFVSAGTFIAILIGTITGGLVAGLDGYVLPLSLGLCFLSALGIFVSTFLKPVPVHDKDVKVDLTFLKPTWDILRLTMRDKQVFYTVLGISWFWFLGSGVLSLVPTMVKNILNGDNTVATFFTAVFTVGMGFGSFLTEKISFKKVEIGIVPISAFGMSIFLVDMCFMAKSVPVITATSQFGLAEFFSHGYAWRAVFDLFMISTFGGGYIVPQMAYIQEISDPAVLSRTIAGNNIWNALFMVVAAGIIMGLSSLGLPNTFLVLGIFSFIASFILYALYSKNTVRLWGWFLSHIMYRVEFKGTENLPENGPYIIASNHISFVDWLLIYAAVKSPVQFIIDWSYYYAPMGPFWFRQAGLIPIATKKESEEVLKKAFDDIHQNLDNGAILGIFPEGWISRDGEMRRFQPGIQKILKEKPVPVVLCGIDGLWGSIFSFEGGKVLTKFPKRFRRKVTLTFSAPIDPEKYDVKEAEKIMRSFVSHYDEEYLEKSEEINGIS